MIEYILARGWPVIGLILADFVLAAIMGWLMFRWCYRTKQD